MKGSLIMFPKASSQDGHLSQEVDRAAWTIAERMGTFPI